MEAWDVRITKNEKGCICVDAPDGTKGYDARGNRLIPYRYVGRRRIFIVRPGNLFSNKKWGVDLRYLKDPHPHFKEVEKTCEEQ